MKKNKTVIIKIQFECPACGDVEIGIDGFHIEVPYSHLAIWRVECPKCRKEYKPR